MQITTNINAVIIRTQPYIRNYIPTNIISLVFLLLSTPIVFFK